MDNLIEKLQALRGSTIDDKVIAELLSFSQSVIGNDTSQNSGTGRNLVSIDECNSVDDLLIASRAAELELDSMRRYFQTPQSFRTRGIDGLIDEVCSSDSDDDVVQECKEAEKSALDKLLAKNSLLSVNDAEEEEQAEISSTKADEVDVSSVPRTIMVPYGAKYIPLGKIQSVVDGLLVISEGNIMNEIVADARSEKVACEVESLVFISDSNPLTVIGMIVDTLGTVKNPIHLVLVTNKEDFAELSGKGSLVGTSVCTLTSHAKIVEVDEISGQAVIKGSPQLMDYEEGDDDGAEEEESPPLHLMDLSVPPQFGYGYSRAA